MNLTLNRFASFDNATLGILHVDCSPVCFTLEDEFREIKISGETRIPEGTYQVKFREVLSGLTKKYRSRYDWFTWHLQLQDIEGFNYVYIHVGNYENQTDGCILVGKGATINDDKQWISNSVAAFKPLYQSISEALSRGETVTIDVK